MFFFERNSVLDDYKVCPKTSYTGVDFGQSQCLQGGPLPVINGVKEPV